MQALVDSPDVVRTQVNFKRLSLTDIKIDITRNPKKKELKAAIDAAGERHLLLAGSYCIVITSHYGSSVSLP